MAKDPVCGMDVSEERAKYMLHFEHETFYFCSEQCKHSFSQQPGTKEPEPGKGVIRRFLEKIAKGTEQSYGGKPPKCH